ncbi:hypothetical protein EUGRSUZ_E03702 [Eucalyptus grandis]|uniref:Uncharacterized protein n=2 Tax=Eucalyptus grandis TaxID=71139 RepID=A0ACC3KZ89_EUCGR|nr:hypothetical protein EUGRSUZ_E03702 [Eucalyptus grandis]
MAETSVHRKSSSDRPNRADEPNPPPPTPLSPRDLISALPDAVIHRIFSFLPLQDVVKTSVLSKRWRPTWTTATDLVFNGEILARLRSTLDFSSLIDSVLIQCISPTVKRFHVTGFNWLVRLEVWVCCFSLGRSIRWPCLKILVIVVSRLSDDILEGIFRGCPVLESLELWSCWGVKNIMIDSTSVKNLVLFGLCDSNIQTICAPHLLSLRISGDWEPHAKLRLNDVSSLVEAKLDFSIRIPTGLPSDERMCSHMLKENLEKLCGVTTITIGVWCLQYSLDEESKESFNCDEEDFLCSRKGNFQCLAKHLKRVEITIDNFGLERLLALIKFLLGDALALEKMIIKANLDMGHVQERVRATVLSKLLVVSQNMLSYRRASKNAEVIFSHSFK